MPQIIKIGVCFT